MNTPNHPPPLTLARTDAVQGTLEERIELAEQRLVAREQALRQGGQALLQRTRTATEPRQLVRPAVCALGALALVWGTVLLRRRRRGTVRPGTIAAPVAPPATPSASRAGEVPWLRAAALLWPLLPVAWRERMGPDTASRLLTVVLPLAGWLFSKRARAPMPPQRSE